MLGVVLLTQGAGLVGLLVVMVAAWVPPPSLGRLLPAVAAGLAGDLGLAAFYRGLAVGSMSVVAPIAASSVTIPVAVGIVGGDRPGTIQLVGIAAAAVGVVLASREAAEGGGGRRAPARGAELALIAALAFGGYFVGLRISARSDVLWALAAARLPGVILLSVLALRLAPVRELLPRRHRLVALLLLAGVMDVSANGLYALATRHGLLSIVSVGASLYPLATVLLARLLLGERVQRLQEVGVVAALAGVVLIAAG